MRRILIALLTLLILAPSATTASAAQEALAPSSTVVLSLPGDEYRPLAEDIAQSERLPLVQSWEEALAGNPETILWVACPRQLSDAVMVRAGVALRQHGALPMVGIFTGSTLEEARQLWQRDQQILSQTGFGAQRRFFAANGEHPTAGAPKATLTDFQTDPPHTMDMDRAALIAALRQADYLTFTGHGSDDYLRIDPQTKLLAGDLPGLPAVIVSTASCQTLRMWYEDSIALGFLHQGAAAYVGFVYSPISGYLMGAFQDLPFRYTWPDFPIGQVVALQTRGTLQGFANIPFYYLLGDPRISLQSEPPYKIAQDETQGDVRTLVLHGAPPGLIPVRVPQAGGFPYVEVPGFAATADGDAFFNARLQAASLGGDKYILVNHPGGDLTLRLYETTPWSWRLSHALIAAFDHLTLFTPLNGGETILLVLGVPALLVALLRGWRLHKRTGDRIGPVALVAGVAGLLVTLFLGAYQVLRLPHAAISTKPLALNMLWLVGVFVLTVSGVSLYLLGRSGWAKLFGLCVAVSPALLPAAFGITAMGAYNVLAGRQVEGMIYNLHMGGLAAIAALAWLLALSAGLWLAGSFPSRSAYTRASSASTPP